MTKQRVDLNLMNVFYAVMTERSVTRAAHRLGMTQPAVSNALQRLRVVLQDDLFTKVRDGVQPTERALTIWPQIEHALDILQSVTMVEEFDPGSTKITFNLAITETLAARAVPALLARMMQEAPGAKVQFHLHSDPGSRLDLQRGTLDCAVGMFPSADDALVFEPVQSDEYVSVVRHDHPDMQRLCDLEVYLAMRHVLVRQSTSWTGIVDTWLAMIGRQRRNVYVVNHAEQAISVVLDTDLVATLPRSFVASDPRRDQLQVVALPFAAEKIVFKLAFHERTLREPAQVWVRKILKDVVRQVLQNN
jgi:DNA-binding transcriptional LysR family regulator